MAKPFVLNDESKLNSFGFAVINSGGKFDRFKENPVMLHLHEQDQLIGKWDNLRVEGSKLIADPIFDEEDENAKKLKGKVDRDFLKGASMGLHIIEMELKDLPTYGLVPVATKWELMEGSIVPVPSNSLSLRLYTAEGKQIISEENIKLSIGQLINKTKKSTMEKIVLTAEAMTALGVTTTELDSKALNDAILKLSTERNNAVKELSDHRTAQATTLVENAIKEGRLTADKKDSFIKLGTTDFKQASDLIAAMPAKMTVSDKINAGQPGGEDRSKWDYLKWSKEDPKGLAKMQKEDPDGFARLKAEYKPKH